MREAGTPLRLVSSHWSRWGGAGSSPKDWVGGWYAGLSGCHGRGVTGQTGIVWATVHRSALDVIARKPPQMERGQTGMARSP